MVENSQIFSDFLGIFSIHDKKIPTSLLLELESADVGAGVAAEVVTDFSSTSSSASVADGGDLSSSAIEKSEINPLINFNHGKYG